LLLVEKWRPKTRKDFVGQDRIMDTSERWIAAKEMPHVIAVGPAGNGKTSWAMWLASQMLGGVDVWHGSHPDFKMLNASDERGIDVVRETMKEYASAGAASEESPFRILYLDEADKITGDAQHAMRNVVEANEHKCRFIMSGNRADYIEPMLSRAATFRFAAIPPGKMQERLGTICSAEHVELGPGVMDAIVAHYKGDLRRAINDTLEKVRGLKRPVAMSDLDFGDDILSVVKTVTRLLTAPQISPQGRYGKAREFFEKEHARLQFDARDFIEQLHGAMGPLAFPAAQAFSEADDRIRSGGIKDVHVGYLLAVIANGGK